MMMIMMKLDIESLGSGLEMVNQHSCRFSDGVILTVSERHLDVLRCLGGKGGGTESRPTQE